MGSGTSSGRTTTRRASSATMATASTATVDTLFSTYETNFGSNTIGDQVVANEAITELRTRLDQTQYANRQDIQGLDDPENATEQQRLAWVQNSSNSQLISNFVSAAGRMSNGIPSSMTRMQYKQTKDEIKRRLGG